MTKDSKICGQCYFITNGEPIPFWDMARYIYKNFGYPEPSIKIPYWFVWILAIILEFISWLISPFIKYSPTFTRLRVANAGANRTFSIKKAKKDFGYQPTISLKEGMEKTLIWFKEQEKLKEQKKEK
jgi:nucleoside-diphosphate-sugar epimerase